jgi:group II intron reverse transcriptase/maturase
MDRTRDEATMITKLTLISEIARRDNRAKINNVAYLLNEANLKECFEMLKEGKAAGIDGIGIEEYGRALDENLKNLVARLKSQAYKPQPVRRTYIPKANGKLRPLGIPSTEDKIVQVGITRILEAIYEPDFLDCSYGFRPKRDCHQAVERLDKIIWTMPVNHVIDCDIKGFFDNVSHSWVLKFLGHRISDPNLLRLIARFLRNGYMEEGTFHASTAGTPQGGIVSPILANVYLHYVLDLWVERVVKPRCRGTVEMVRYADDFVICVQHKDEADKILKSLKGRLEKFGLTLAEEKTRIIEFGRFAGPNAKRNGTKLKEMNQWLREIRNQIPIREWWTILKAKLVGHFRYYGISGNSRSIGNFYDKVVRMVFKWINRRSQKMSMDWSSFAEYRKRHELPKPRIYHSLYAH